MTTPNIEELRLLAQTLEFSDAVRCSIQRAADLLQSQAERIKELEQALQTGPEIIAGLFARAAFMESERDTLRAQLADAELHTKQVERGLDKATAQLAKLRKDLIEEFAAAPAPQAQPWEPVYQYQMADGSWIDQIKDSYDYNRKYVHNATIRVVYTATPAPQAQEPACPECGASLLYECVACSYTNYPKKQDMKPQAQDKSNNYLNGYCTGRTDLLKEQAAPQAQGEPTGCACRWDADDNRVATCARHQGWLDVVHEWAERAKATEAALQSAQPKHQWNSGARIAMEPETFTALMANGEELAIVQPHQHHSQRKVFPNAGDKPPQVGLD